MSRKYTQYIQYLAVVKEAWLGGGRGVVGTGVKVCTR